jgi:group I intron endonuclease
VNRYGVIYKITNLKNDRCYIGQTTKENPWKRIRVHYRDSTMSYINKAITKHGESCFKWEILMTCFDKKGLNRMEKYFVKYFNSMSPNGYNLKEGGDCGGKSSKITKLKQSLKRKHLLKNKTPKWKGKKRSKETRELMSKQRKGFTSKNRIRARVCSNYKRKKNGDFVRVTAIHTKTGKESSYDTITDCCKDLNLDSTCVSRVCRGKDGRTQHKGYTFITEKYGDSRECHTVKTSAEKTKRSKK